VQAPSASLIADFMIMIKRIYKPLSVETVAKLWKLIYLNHVKFQEFSLELGCFIIIIGFDFQPQTSNI